LQSPNHRSGEWRFEETPDSSMKGFSIRPDASRPGTSVRNGGPTAYVASFPGDHVIVRLNPAPSGPGISPMSTTDTDLPGSRFGRRLDRVTVERRDVPGLAEPPGYRHYAVASGRFVFTAGAVPLDPTGRLVGPDDYRAQTEQVMANLLTALEAAGARPEQVVKTTVYVVGEGREPKVAVWDVVQRSELAEAPSTLVGVAGLGYSGQLVEIDVVAVIDEEGTSPHPSRMPPS
jgi:enamine deaminase RidA (YjgF/YER057c/UK114 family)